MLDVHLGGTVRCARAAYPLLRRQGGSIVNVASISAFLGAGGRASYAAAKGGIVALTRDLAVEWAADGIRVNAVAPGVIETEIITRNVERGVLDRAVFDARIPLGRTGQPAEIAEAVLFLATRRVELRDGPDPDRRRGLHRRVRLVAYFFARRRAVAGAPFASNSSRPAGSGASCAPVARRVRRRVAGEARDDEVAVRVRDLDRAELAAGLVPLVDPVEHPEDRDRRELRRRRRGRRSRPSGPARIRSRRNVSYLSRSATMICRRSPLSERKSLKKTPIFTRFSALWVKWTTTNARIFCSAFPSSAEIRSRFFRASSWTPWMIS